MAPLFADRILAWSRRRLAALGRDRSASAGAPSTPRRARLRIAARCARSEVMEVAAREGIEVNVQRRTHLSIQLVVEGHACIGPDAGRESTFVATRDWIGEPEPRDREASLGRTRAPVLQRLRPRRRARLRVLVGPAAGQCRIGIERAIAAELTELEVAGETLLAPKGWTRPGAALAGRPPARGVRHVPPGLRESRPRRGGGRGARRILPGGGVLRPTICVDGRLVGLWSSRSAAAAGWPCRSSRSELDTSWRRSPRGRGPRALRGGRRETRVDGRFENSSGVEASDALRERRT